MEPLARLIISTTDSPEQEITLGGKLVSLGRAPNNEIIIQDAKASRSHAQIELEGDSITVIDLNSANGTRVNGKLIKRAELSPGDIIEIGKTTLRYEIGLDIEPTLIEEIHSESELELTLNGTMLDATLGDTSIPQLVINTSEKTWEVPFQGETLTVGRDKSSDIALDHPKVSREHARIERQGDNFTLRDLDSRNGTWVRGQRIDSYDLQSGDAFQIGDAQIVFKQGFQPEELTMIESPGAPSNHKHRPVVFVPGMMGSELKLGGDLIWPRVRYLFTHPDILSLPDFRPVTVGGIVQEVVIVPNLIKQDQYNLLGDYLEEGLGYERGNNFLEFAYDWRQDVRESARHLAETIDKWEVESPVTIIAHSLGTLVCRYYVEVLGGKNKVERVILLGGPHGGVPYIISTLFNGPDVLPFGLLGERMRDVLSTFPSTYQTLPTEECVFDQDGKAINIFEDESWLPEEQIPFLRMAREFRKELGSKSSVPAISIFGYGIETVTGLTVERQSNGMWKNLEFESNPSGDDRIPEGSAILQGTEIHPVQQHHGKLFVDNDVKMRLKLELMR